ncbi:MAG: universal stress protein [Bacteroidales bacterium]|nr:universal stress protein [Bacteroidales bacterium]
MKQQDHLIIFTVQTFEKAHILKTIFESAGIETILQNENLIQPFVSSGVKVKIQEKDKLDAIKILKEFPEFSKTLHLEDIDVSLPKKILVPIDFSIYSKKACSFAFNLAKKENAQVYLLHAYFMPYIPGAYPDADIYINDLDSEITSVENQKKVKKQVEDFEKYLRTKILEGSLPYIPYEMIITEGIPEEEISRWSKDYHPSLIVMGTRGKNQKEIDLIGSVTAEVMDTSKSPVFAIPEKTTIKVIDDIKRLAYVTNFDQRDLVGFNSLMNMPGFKEKEISFIYLMDKDEKKSETKLEIGRQFIEKYYPEIPFVYDKVNEETLLSNTDDFIKDNNIDVLVLNTHKRNIFARLFNPSIAHKVLFHSDTPLLVIRN